jgi:hypothetical protein
MKYMIWSSYAPGSGFAFVKDFTGWTDKEEQLVFFGKPITGRIPHLTITKLTRARIPDALGTHSYYPFVSMKLRRTLEVLTQSVIQFLPVSLPSYPKKKYFLPNVLIHVACLDRSRSIYESFSTAPYAINYLKKLVLLPVPKSTPPIFHMSEIPTVLLVRDDLCDQMKRASSSPGTFLEVETFTMGIS